MILQKLARAIVDLHPEVELIVLLVDERPEEVTGGKMKELVEAVEREVRKWPFEGKAAEVHVDVRFYIQ